MRTVKSAQERRNEILDVASELFVQKGFEGTSTNDILEKVGIARGTLYYHFKSKEEILDAIVERINQQVVERLEEIVCKKEIPIMERLVLAVRALRVDTELGEELMEQVHKPQNALMHQKMQEMLLRQITPLFQELIEEGIQQGLVETHFPKETLEMILLYAFIMFDDEMEQSEEERNLRIKAFVFNVERLLGAPTGSLAKAVLQCF